MSQTHYRKAWIALLAAYLTLPALDVQAQSYHLQVETFATHEGLVGSADLSGQTTYRYYIQTQQPTDEIVNVFGNADLPLAVQVETAFFNSEFALGATANGITPEALALQPEVEYDSYVTIGLTQEANAGAGELGIEISEDVAQEWSTAFIELANGAGQSLSIDTPLGGNWSAPSGASNRAAGEDLRVLVMQITTTGAISGQLNAEIAIGGDPSNTFVLQQSFNGTETTTPCSDPSACNYDADAPVNLLSTADCVYADEGYDCSGNCIEDTDGDGVCDEFEISGCQDDLAFNFDPMATDDSDDCIYPDELGCHDEAACNYEPYVGGDLCLQIETVAVHEGAPGLEDLAGYTTYKVYVLCENPDDFVSSVSGDDEFPTFASSSAPFYQSQFGGALGSNLQVGLFGFFPNEAFDSYVTIGLEGPAGSGEGAINSIDSPGNPWADNFEEQGVLAIDDAIGGAWFIFNGNTNGIAGEDHRVLLGQFTTTGDLDGQMYVQVFLNGSPSTEIRQLLSFGAACYGPETSVGCEYPSEDVDCEGNCIADADGDGVCDGLEVLGCDDETSCNYDADATENDGSCTYPEAGLDCAGNCLTDLDGDGICDEAEVLGCTDATAFNFDASATEDDGSCLLPACIDETACNFDGNIEAPAAPCLTLESYAVHEGMVGEVDLAGFTTYRIYATLPNADDFISSVSGDSDFPTVVATNTTFYQDPNGVGLGSNNQPNLWAFLPALAYDSWVTIGLDGPPAGNEGVINSIASSEADWLANFENGGNLEIADAIGGAWYVLNGDANGIAGPDHRVLLGQFTTDGELSGQLYLQVFINGNPAEEVRTTVSIADACGAFSNSACDYPESGLDCEGNCVADADGDGICDADEIAGCDDPTACNFDENATDNDGSCTYPTDALDCDGNCLNDTDGDGTCDELELMGCTDVEASNYEPWATEEDGSCIEPSCHDEAACNYMPWAGAGGVCLAIETIAVHEGMVGSADLSGMATYRVYAILDNADDFISSVAGDSEFPTNINTTTSFFQSTLGSGVASGLQPGLFAMFPDLNYDSWVTIGLEGPAGAGEGAIQTINAEANDWLAHFETGGNIAIDDPIGGAWFIFGDNVNGIAGEDHKVLLGQFTTSGVLSGQLYVQSFTNGNPAQVVRETIDLSSPCMAYDLTTCTYPEEGLDCDGACLADADGDGICDADEISGCTAAGACNFDPNATDDNGACAFADGNCEVCDGEGGVAIQDADGDGVCDADEVTGCQDEAACNYDAFATDSDNSCVFADGNCEVCNGEGGVALQDADGDGVCDGDEVAGCQDANACNYDAFATDSDSSCVFADGNCEVCDGEGGVALQDADGDGVCDNDEIAGCTVTFACNFDPEATDDNGSCVFAVNPCEICEAGAVVLQDADGDGVCDGDEVAGCQDSNACNYDSTATDDDGSCTFADGNCEVCNGEGGVAIQDADGDGVCDGDEVAGCQDDTACNYDSAATDSDDSCAFADGICEVCDGEGGVTVQDADGDGVCDGDEVAGCQDANALNYNPEATDDDDSCVFPVLQITTTVCFDASEVRLTGPWWGWDPMGGPIASSNGDGTWTFTFDPAPTDNMEYLLVVDGVQENLIADMVDGGTCAPITDFWSYANRLWEVGSGDVTGIIYGTCDAECPVPGCTDAMACNFDESATEDDSSCVYAEAEFDCNGACLEDTDADGVCDAFEVEGCQDATACNYDALATDPGSCEYADTGYDCDGNCLGDADDDGICDANEVPGCMDPEACNFDDAATDENGTCSYPVSIAVDCEGNCLEDTDGDGICDPLEVGGCTDAAACNFSGSATDDDGSCTYPNCVYDCNGDCNNDADGDGICDELEGQNLAPICGPGTVWNEEMGYCEITSDPCWRFDSNLDGHIQLQDLMDFLEVYGTYCD